MKLESWKVNRLAFLTALKMDKKSKVENERKVDEERLAEEEEEARLAEERRIEEEKRRDEEIRRKAAEKAEIRRLEQEEVQHFPFPYNRSVKYMQNILHCLRIRNLVNPVTSSAC